MVLCTLPQDYLKNAHISPFTPFSPSPFTTPSIHHQKSQLQQSEDVSTPVPDNNEKLHEIENPQPIQGFCQQKPEGELYHFIDESTPTTTTPVALLPNDESRDRFESPDKVIKAILESTSISQLASQGFYFQQFKEKAFMEVKKSNATLSVDSIRNYSE